MLATTTTNVARLGDSAKLVDTILREARETEADLVVIFHNINIFVNAVEAHSQSRHVSEVGQLISPTMFEKIKQLRLTLELLMDLTQSRISTITNFPHRFTQRMLLDEIKAGRSDRQQAAFRLGEAFYRLSLSLEAERKEQGELEPRELERDPWLN